MARRSNKDWIVGTYSDKSLTDMSSVLDLKKSIQRFDLDLKSFLTQ
jgi:hypothetical protein